MCGIPSMPLSPYQLLKSSLLITSSSPAESTAPWTPVNHVMIVGHTVIVFNHFSARFSTIIALQWIDANCEGR